MRKKKYFYWKFWEILLTVNMKIIREKKPLIDTQEKKMENERHSL